MDQAWRLSPLLQGVHHPYGSAAAGGVRERGGHSGRGGGLPVLRALLLFFARAPVGEHSVGGIFRKSLNPVGEGFVYTTLAEWRGPLRAF